MLRVVFQSRAENGLDGRLVLLPYLTIGVALQPRPKTKGRDSYASVVLESDVGSFLRGLLGRWS